MHLSPKTQASLVICLLMLLFARLMATVNATPSNPSIYGRVLDASTGLPIPNATIVIWDLNTLQKPKLGAGIYRTNDKGEYNASGSYLKPDHSYRVYAYRGNFTKRMLDYVPALQKLRLGLTTSEANASFYLVPGGLVTLEGSVYLVQSSSPGGGRLFINVANKGDLNLIFNASYISDYGDYADSWFLGLGREVVPVPADVPVILEARIWFFSREQSSVMKEMFQIRDGQLPFQIAQGGLKSSGLSEYSLRGGIDAVDTKLLDVSSEIDQAQGIGFLVFEERRSLAQGRQEVVSAQTMLITAQNDEDYLEVWSILRNTWIALDFISLGLVNMRLVSMANSLYLPAIMAVFSAVLAFFFFENERKKIVSSVAIYVVFLILLYFLYPGAHIVIDENFPIFLGTATVSFLGVSVLVFAVPRVWKELDVEGEVPTRSAISIVFSMAKRQIRRRKIRGFFTILSIIILVLAFTSLTSFGTVFGIVSERLEVTAPSDGILVKRVINQTSLLFSPLGSDDPSVLKKVMNIGTLALRLQNMPSSNPIGQLMNPIDEDKVFLFGMLGIVPANESSYTHLEEIIEEGSYLSEASPSGILIGANLARKVGLEANDNVTLEILGVSGIPSDFVVTGVFNDDGYDSLTDLDGELFGPPRLLSDGTVRACNSTEVVIMNWRTLKNLQEMANALQPEGAPQFAVLSEIVFKPDENVDVDSITRSLIFVFDYTVFLSSNEAITHYYIGSYIEFKGAAELLIPLVMVTLNVGTVMLNSVYERRKEIRTLSMLGLNPTFIGLIFLAEAIITGMVGGSLGYLFGLGFYRITVLFGQELMVREKLEWWWSAIGFAIALLASVLSAIRPAALAVSTYTPSKIKKLKLSEEEAKVRREGIFRVYQARELSMPIKVNIYEKDFFILFFLDSLDELRTGYIERIENVEEMPDLENVKGELVKEVKFEYCLGTGLEKKTLRNRLTLVKSPYEDYYRVRLSSEPAVPGIPEKYIDRASRFVHDITLYWAKNKGRIMGA